MSTYVYDHSTAIREKLRCEETVTLRGNIRSCLVEEEDYIYAEKQPIVSFKDKDQEDVAKENKEEFQLQEVATIEAMSIAGIERRRLRDEIINLSQADGEGADRAAQLLLRGGPTLRDLIDGKFDYESKTVVGFITRTNDKAKDAGNKSALDKYSASDDPDTLGGQQKGNKSFMYVKKEKSTASKEDQANSKRVHFKFDTDRGIKSQVYTADKRSMIQNIANNVLQVKGDSKAIGKYFVPADGLRRTSSGHGSGIIRPNTLQIPIAEEKSDSKKTGGTGGDDNVLDDLLKDDDEDKD